MVAIRRRKYSVEITEPEPEEVIEETEPTELRFLKPGWLVSPIVMDPAKGDRVER